MMKKMQIIKILTVAFPFMFSASIHAQINDGLNIGIVGSTSSSTGMNNTGGGLYSFSTGVGNIATGDYSNAFGRDNVSSEHSSIALGIHNISSGHYSIAAGGYSESRGIYSIALGRNAIAQGIYSRSIGFYSEAIGDHSFALGNNIRTTAIRAFVIGSGANPSNPLLNEIPNSMMVGFSSDVPTLYVGPSDGVGTSGNVGIGTTEPKGKLDVHSSPSFAEAPRFTMSSESTNFTGVNTSLSLVNLDETPDNWSRMHFVGPAGEGGEEVFASIATQYRNKVSGEETGDFVIATRGEGEYSEKFRIAGNGNVGIGTTKLEDDFKLSVDGSIRAVEIEVSLSGPWADYVFADEYKLKSLEEVEKYIQENNHLPNIPSAKELEEGGLNLGEMQVKMMEKIEELTLYVIALKKENELQQKMIEKLSAK